MSQSVNLLVVRGISCLLLIILFLGVNSSAQTKKKNEFHPPITKQELKLDSIFKLYETDHNMYEFLLKRPGYKVSPKYQLLFTNALTGAIAAAEKKTVKANGGYEEGEMSGIDWNLICAQDIPDHYLYRTIKQNDSMATIGYAWPKNEYNKGNTVATYRLVKQNNMWLLDGVACTAGYHFNMDPIKPMKKFNKSKKSK